MIMQFTNELVTPLDLHMSASVAEVVFGMLILFGEHVARCSIKYFNDECVSQRPNETVCNYTYMSRICDMSKICDC